MTNSSRQCRNPRNLPRKGSGQLLRWPNAKWGSRIKWRRLIVIAALATGFSLTLFLTTPTRYSATTTLQLDPKHGTLSNDASYDVIEADDAVAAKALSDIRSHELALAVVVHLKLQERPEFLDEAPLWQRIPSTLMSLRGQETSQRDSSQIQQKNSRFDFMDEARENDDGKTFAIDPKLSRSAATVAALIKTRRLRNTLLITITAKASDPELAARIADTAADVYISRKLARKKRLAQERMRAAEDRIAELRAQIGAAKASPQPQATVLANPIDAPDPTLKINALTQQLNEEMETGRQADTSFGLHLPDARIVEQAADRPVSRTSQMRAAIGSLVTGLLCAIVFALVIALLSPRKRKSIWPPAYIDLALTQPRNLPMSHQMPPTARKVRTRPQRST
ncbi:Chain length determinant protein [Filomicrobium insigne]|uniref:Chain length determinant protein n=1 Tax=Filomicrobium insigne TaxID=418854 RepID=A0A1H0MG40_9HYPH|nr:Chain length determinant protein [Filomicrobium insigne]